MPTITVDEANFEQEVLACEQPVLVDFWAEWCGPCKAIAPALEELSDNFAGRLQVAKIDIDKSPALAQRYGVRSIPALALIKGGELLDFKTGAAPKARIEAWVEDKIA